MKIEKATRRAVSLLLGIGGVSASGKTYSALLVAAGLAHPGGKIGFIDTENKRGTMYADSPGIKRAMPQGYDIIDFASPYTPARYIEAIDVLEQSGYQVGIIDSGTHEWEGIGGCSEMAEADKGRWNRPKKEHKKFVNRLLNSNMHWIICLRARDKVKIISKQDSPDGKEHIIPLGLQPICEKNFMFEMMLSFTVAEGTHLATAIKVPEMFADTFARPRLLTKADGEAIAAWNNGAPREDPIEKLQRQAKAAAEDGMERYGKFFAGLSGADKKVLTDTTHAENKGIAKYFDEQAANAAMEQEEQEPAIA